MESLIGNLDKKYLIGAIVIIVILLLALMIYSLKSSNPQSQNLPAPSQSNSHTSTNHSRSGYSFKLSDPNANLPTPAPGRQLFKDSAYAQYAYQIFPGSLSSGSQRATNGFSISSVALPDGSYDVHINSVHQNYYNQTVNVKNGFSLYFIELDPTDDKISNVDSDAGDDGVMLVDPQGYIVP